MWGEGGEGEGGGQEWRLPLTYALALACVVFMLVSMFIGEIQCKKPGRKGEEREGEGVQRGIPA